MTMMMPDHRQYAHCESGVVTALEKLEELAGEAITRAADGPPQETAPKPAAPVRESVPSAGLAFEMLGALDDKIKLNRRMSRTLESMARAVFRQWFVDGDEVED